MLITKIAEKVEKSRRAAKSRHRNAFGDLEADPGQPLPHHMGREEGVSHMADRPNPERSAQQDDLVRKYCAEAERMLSEAADYATAIQLKESLCDQFQKECDSSLVVTAARKYLDGVISERWKNRRPHNGAGDGRPVS
jgi:hypothetical protein